jgi:transposase
MLWRMEPLSNDLRRRVIRARQEGLSLGRIAEHYRLSKSGVQHLVEHFRSTGSIERKPPNTGRKPAFDAAALRRLEQDVLAHPVHNTLRNTLGFTRKKSLYMRASSAGRT